MITVSIYAQMGLGGQEMIFIFLALILWFGAEKIPELAWGTASKNSKTPPKRFAATLKMV